MALLPCRILLWLWGRRSLRIETISIPSLILLWIHSVATIDVRLSVKNASFKLVAFRFLEVGMEGEGEIRSQSLGLSCFSLPSVGFWILRVQVQWSVWISVLPLHCASNEFVLDTMNKCVLAFMVCFWCDSVETYEHVRCFYSMLLIRFFRDMWTSVLPLHYASNDFTYRHVNKCAAFTLCFLWVSLETCNSVGELRVLRTSGKR